MPQEFLSTPGGNIYPDPETSYDQSEAFRLVAVNRDALDATVAGDILVAAAEEAARLDEEAQDPAPLGAENLNDVPTGVYYQSNSANVTTAQGYPINGIEGVGLLKAESPKGSAYGFQEYRTYGTFNEVYVRARYTTNWYPWKKLTGNFITVHPFPAANANLNTVITPGQYPILALISNWQEQNYPSPFRGTLTVEATGSNFKWQTYKTAPSNIANPPELFMRFFNGTAWGAWAKIGGAPGGTVVPTDGSTVGQLGIRHDFKKTDLLEYYGGPINTGGAAPVALVWDDYPREFRDAVLPLFKARGIPVTLALNSRIYDPAALTAGGIWATVYNGATGTTWAEIDAWTVNDDVEIANHGATHQSATTAEQMQAEIVDGLTELQAALPSKPIFCWVQPSAEYDPGFNNGDSVNAYATTVAGKLITDHHALATGTRLVYGRRTVARRGEPIQGIGRQWVSTDAAIPGTQSAVQRCIDNDQGIIIGGHANDISGNQMSIAGLSGFLDWLVAEQDAGRIKLMKLSEWAIADSRVTASPGGGSLTEDPDNPGLYLIGA